MFVFEFASIAARTIGRIDLTPYGFGKLRTRDEAAEEFGDDI
jgi:hypothetical protein